MTDLSTIPSQTLLSELTNRCISGVGAFQLPSESGEAAYHIVVAGDVEVLPSMYLMLGARAFEKAQAEILEMMEEEELDDE